MEIKYGLLPLNPELVVIPIFKLNFLAQADGDLILQADGSAILVET